MDRFEIKRASLVPALRATLTMADPTMPDVQVPLALEPGMAIEFRMQPAQRPDADPLITGEAELIDEETALVEYAWQPGDTDTLGDFIGEFWVTRVPLTAPEKIPSDRYLAISVLPDVS